MSLLRRLLCLARGHDVPHPSAALLREWLSHGTFLHSRVVKCRRCESRFVECVESRGADAALLSRTPTRRTA